MPNTYITLCQSFIFIFHLFEIRKFHTSCSTHIHTLHFIFKFFTLYWKIFHLSIFKYSHIFIFQLFQSCPKLSHIHSIMVLRLQGNNFVLLQEHQFSFTTRSYSIKIMTCFKTYKIYKIYKSGIWTKFNKPQNPKKSQSPFHPWSLVGVVHFVLHVPCLNMFTRPYQSILLGPTMVFLFKIFEELEHVFDPLLHSIGCSKFCTFRQLYSRH